MPTFLSYELIFLGMGVVSKHLTNFETLGGQRTQSRNENQEMSTNENYVFGGPDLFSHRRFAQKK